MTKNVSFENVVYQALEMEILQLLSLAPWVGDRGEGIFFVLNCLGEYVHLVEVVLRFAGDLSYSKLRCIDC